MENLFQINFLRETVFPSLRDFRDIFHITRVGTEGVKKNINLLRWNFQLFWRLFIYPPSYLNFQQLFTLKNLLTTFYVNKNIDYNCIKYN